MGWKPITQVITPLTGNDLIDALIDTDYTAGQDPRSTYNYQLPFTDHINVSFSTADYVPFPDTSVNPSPKIAKVFAMTETQKNGVRAALGYISSVTGINFKETKSSATESNDLFFGVTSESLTKDGNTYSGFDYQSITKKYDIYGIANTFDLHDSNLISNDVAFSDLSPGTSGYQLILGLICLDLGMKRPDEGNIKLGSDYTKADTILSPNSDGKTHSTLSPMDITALGYLYGGDGLRGQWGLTVDEFGNPVSHGAPPSSGSSAMVKSQDGAFAQS
jgi:serralysin